MSKVMFIVERCFPYEGCQALAVFDDRGKAHAWLKTQEDPSELEVTEMPFNPPPATTENQA